VREAAAGLTNPQIAERLLIARATVKTHLSSVYGKLGVRNRSQLAAQAAGRLPPLE
jgi:DNA-binding CsgD family transcriptional regulator